LSLAVHGRILGCALNNSDDISSLFAKFGGRPGQYQELGRVNNARNSEARWPLLSSIKTSASDVPGVAGADAAASKAATPPSHTRERTEPSFGPARGTAPTPPLSRPIAQGTAPVKPDVARSAALPATETAARPAAYKPEAPAAAEPRPAPRAQFIPPRPRDVPQPASAKADGSGSAPGRRMAPARDGSLTALFNRLQAVPPATRGGAGTPAGHGAPSRGNEPAQPASRLSVFERLSRS